MVQQHAERAGAAPAEDSQPGPTIMAVPIYGRGGYRERNAQIFGSDPSLRWFVDRHRGELIAAGAIGLIAGRLVAFLPLFDHMVMRFAREALGYRHEARQRAMSAAIAAVSQGAPSSHAEAAAPNGDRQQHGGAEA